VLFPKASHALSEESLRVLCGEMQIFGTCWRCAKFPYQGLVSPE